MRKARETALFLLHLCVRFSRSHFAYKELFHGKGNISQTASGGLQTHLGKNTVSFCAC